MQIVICIISFIINFITLLLSAKIDLGSCTVRDVILTFIFSLLSLVSLTPIPLAIAAIVAFSPTVAAFVTMAIFKLENSNFFDKKLF